MATAKKGAKFPLGPRSLLCFDLDRREASHFLWRKRPANSPAGGEVEIFSLGETSSITLTSQKKAAKEKVEMDMGTDRQLQGCQN